MAEELEDIIIIEDSDAAGFKDIHAEEEILSEEDPKKQKNIIFAALAIAVLILIAMVTIIIFKSSPPSEVIPLDFPDEKFTKETKQTIEPSKLENMIAKANYLYSSGSKEEALFLYEKIASFSEAISEYNLGVAQLKNEQYDVALETFKRAILNDEKRCVSAINAAVCSLHLEDEASFNYYIDLAYAYLSKEIDSPIYSYYYALINYYKGNYLEALSALKNPTSKEYPTIQKHLSAKINALFGNEYDAIEAMEDNFDKKDSFNIGLLYANVGDLTLAKKHLEYAVQNNIEPVKAGLALGLINLKAGQITRGSNDIKNITDMFPEEVYKIYPIKVTLKESLFEPLQAQSQYRKLIATSNLINYQKIFYFSPYKIFNADQTISYIRKGNANILIDDVDTAEEYLKKSSSSSSVNKGIILAIKKALSFKIREANEEFKKVVKIQPKHSILQYNLALTYAQMGNMIDAHKHFVLSYHLDAKNYLSGVYALMTSQLIQKENPKLNSILKDALMEENDSEELTLYKTLINISENNLLASTDWLNNDFKQRPLYLALDIIIALEVNKLDLAKKSAQKLTFLLPNDILPHLMYIDSAFSQLQPTAYASEVLNYLKVQKFHFNDLYFGPYITRYLYIQESLITGKLYYLREQLKAVLESTKESVHELTSALALASLYDKAFEESFTLYNQLIDDLKVRDAHTLFLGAVASTAANHHANAIALLELSKMKNPLFLESRYALGLLYMEVKNNQGAVIQLSKVGNNGFNSEYFNFEVDRDLLMFDKQHPKK